ARPHRSRCHNHAQPAREARLHRPITAPDRSSSGDCDGHRTRGPLYTRTRRTHDRGKLQDVAEHVQFRRTRHNCRLSHPGGRTATNPSATAAGRGPLLETLKNFTKPYISSSENPRRFEIHWPDLPVEFFIRDWIATAFITVLFAAFRSGGFRYAAVAAREDPTATFGLNTWPVSTLGPGAITATERRSTTQREETGPASAGRHRSAMRCYARGRSCKRSRGFAGWAGFWDCIQCIQWICRLRHMTSKPRARI